MMADGLSIRPAASTEALCRVILESPYAGDVQRNIAYARACVRDCLMRGEAPIASHLLFTQPGILRDDAPDERKLGIDAGHAWIGVAQLMAVYTDHGISRGMQLGIDRASLAGLPVEFRRLPEAAAALRARPGREEVEAVLTKLYRSGRAGAFATHQKASCEAAVQSAMAALGFGPSP